MGGNNKFDSKVFINYLIEPYDTISYGKSDLDISKYQQQFSINPIWIYVIDFNENAEYIYIPSTKDCGNIIWYIYVLLNQ